MVRVMVIEDNVNSVREMREYFKNSNSISISYVAYNGDDALRLISSYDDYDLIVLDLVMPVRDGLSILYNLRFKKINKDIIVTTNLNIPALIKEVSELGVRYYILKPFNYEILEERINNISYKIPNLDNKICSLLHQVGIPSHIKGYSYIKESLSLINENRYRGHINELYKVLASNNNTTIARVERTIRHAVELCFSRGDIDILEKMFGNSLSLSKSKPTNKEFILTMAERLKNNN